MEYLINLTKEISPPHKHKNYEIIIYTRGEGIFHTNKKDIETAPGIIIIVPPATLHGGTTKIDENYERIYINGDFNHIFNLTSPTVINDNSNGEGLALAKIIYNNRFSDHAYITALINAFAHFLVSCTKVEKEISLAIQNIINKITDNFYCYDINLCAVLKESGYSEDYIRAQFKKVTGKTPTEFLTETRISHACYLIDSYKNSIPLTAVSEQSGYADYIYFSRMFKRIMGVSPRKYMKNGMNF